MQLKFRFEIDHQLLSSGLQPFTEELVGKANPFSTVNLRKTIVENICGHPVSSSSQPDCFSFE